MSKNILVGLVGHAGAGKDTFCAGVQRRYDAQRFAFADKIKEVVSSVYDVPIAHFHDRELKNTPHPHLYGKTPTEAVNLIGTEGFRHLIGRDTWLDCGTRQIERMLTRQSVIVTDVRFPNEAEAIRLMGGFLIGIVRPDGQEVRAHISASHIETIQREYCHIELENSRTQQAFEAEAQELFRALLG